ncbi:MAG: MarR family transcriptional regulator [Oscillospiraceae bacterium]|nr:MarR family transcriptional regulator [Oscillospiraceae bacterium]
MQKDSVLAARFIESLNRIQHLRFKPDSIGELGAKDVALMIFVFHHNLNSPNGITVSFVSDSIGVTRSSVTQQTNRLLKLGYITKISDAADRRSVRITLTDKGMAFVKNTDKKRKGFTIDLINYLGEDDSNEAIRLLDKITEFLNQRKNCGGSK